MEQENKSQVSEQTTRIIADGKAIEIRPENFFFYVAYDHFKLKIYCKELTNKLIFISNIVTADGLVLSEQEKNFIERVLKEYVTANPRAERIQDAFELDEKMVFITTQGFRDDHEYKIKINDKTYLVYFSPQGHLIEIHMNTLRSKDGFEINGDEKNFIEKAIIKHNKIQNFSSQIKFRYY